MCSTKYVSILSKNIFGHIVILQWIKEFVMYFSHPRHGKKYEN